MWSAMMPIKLATMIPSTGFTVWDALNVEPAMMAMGEKAIIMATM